ncbi:MAG: hypothetical protein P0Y62_11455 [Candidatus Chryseobacterium colombiense]|nr:hypothetical protein [Chryseobacterium sp.]WEK68476.1 MAG: hypothetical protein P0Y62_11455 [Chryseobacterium sp.]
MKENYEIQIGYKCPLKLSNNSDFIDGKRFCELCNKNVYDLRNLSDQEIHALTIGKESICGRIQVDRVSNLTTNNQGFFRKLMTSFALFAFIGSVFSQKKEKDTLQTREIDGFTLVALRSDNNDNEYYSPKSRLIGGFKVGEKYIKNTKILKLNQSSITEGSIDYMGEISFSIDEYLVKKENIILIPTTEPNTYRYKIIKKEQFEDLIYQNIDENNIIKAELPEKDSSHNIYFIDGEKVDYDEFSETVNANSRDFSYFLLNPELASIWLEEKNKKYLYIAYSK